MTEKTNPPTEQTKRLHCGIVMPISSIDGCPDSHWQDVKEIIFESVESAGFEASLVSEADDVGIIQKRIIQNLYGNPIVVCDVSGKNPNVMFELGMRLAFDKPTIIVKDDKTPYTFDTAPIEHLEYPRDLRFGKIVDFKEALSEKIKGTHLKATKDAKYTTFLKHFGTFTVPKLDTAEVSKESFILDELQQLRQDIQQIRKSDSGSGAYRGALSSSASRRTVCLRFCKKETAEQVLAELRKINSLEDLSMQKVATDHYHMPMGRFPLEIREEALSAAKIIIDSARLL